MLNAFERTEIISNIINDTEKEFLVREMATLFERYDYEWSDHALDKIINKWAYNMQELIAHFKKHPDYVEGKFLIASTSSIDRPMDIGAVCKFKSWLLRSDNLQQVRDNQWLPEEVEEQRIADWCTWLPSDMWDVLSELEKYTSEQFLSEETATRLNAVFPKCHVRKGKKASRVCNEIFTYLGFTKLTDYNREYAKFADALSPVTIQRNTILSINPLDYLTMSFGNSWASCHTIDKDNRRNMPNSYHGMYSSGTISYMLDGSSMVFYTVDTDYKGTDYWTEPKINRQMFHWGEEKLVQGRLYPQDNDGDASAYTPYRNIVQSIMSAIYDFPNLWTVQKGISYASKYIESRGTHYRDYGNFNSCTLSRIKGTVNDNTFVVGHRPICIECGSEHTVSENINCCGGGSSRCTNCGERLYEDDIRWVDGRAYCEDCASWCDHCNEWVITETTCVSNGDYVCQDCLDEYYEYCEHCDEYYYRGDTYYIESEDRYVCTDCVSNHYTYCARCDSYHSNDCVRYVASEDVYVCDDCAEEYYTVCYDCDELVRNRDVVLGDDDNYRCPECHANYIAEDKEEAM